MEKESVLKIEIDKYINGELTGEGLVDFEKRLMADDTLKANVNSQKEIHENLLASKAYKKQDARMSVLMDGLADEFILEDAAKKESAKLVDLKPTRNVETTSKKGKRPLIKWLLPAAALAAAAVLLLMFFPFGNASLPTYADKNYEVYPANFTNRGAVDDLAKAGNFYETQKWNAALGIFAKHTDNDKAKMAKGNCEYQLKQYDNAIATFKKIVNNNSGYSESATWYLALSYLKKDNKNQAVVYLKKLPSNSKYFKKAKNLLDKLD